MSNAFGQPSPTDPHPALGDVQRTSNLTGQRRSLALTEAADNLLDKALQGMHDGDQERTARFIRRATELPWDSHEQVHPAAQEAHMMLFNAVVDAMNESPEDDLRWLTTALKVIDAVGERAADELRSVLVVVHNDQGPSPREADLIRSSISTTPRESAAYLLPESSTADEIISVMDPILEAFLAYYRAYYEDAAAE